MADSPYDFITLGYIHFHKNVVAKELQASNAYFDKKYQLAVGSMRQDALEKQLNAVRTELVPQSEKAASALKILSQLQSGTLLDEIMELIANSLNTSIEKIWNNNEFETLTKQGKKFNKALENGPMSTAQVDTFLNLVLRAAELGGTIDANSLAILTELGKYLSYDENFKITGGWEKKATAVPVDLKVGGDAPVQKMVRYLVNAAQSFAVGGGTLSNRSFSSTINNMFSTAAGEPSSNVLLQNVSKNIESNLDQMLLNTLEKSLGQGAKVKVQPVGPNWTQGGNRKDANRQTSKVDLFNQDAFQITVTVNGQTMDIVLAANTSVKWYKKITPRSHIGMVKGSPLNKYFQDSSLEKYYAYNVIAHRFSGQQFHDAYRRVRAATAATFFNDWMTGSGAQVGNLGTNRVQFLMVNGKLYSVMTIINNIVKELSSKSANTESKDMPINMSITRQDANKWQTSASGESGPNWELAFARSRIVNEVLNKSTISATLNANVLLKYAKPSSS